MSTETSEALATADAPAKTAVADAIAALHAQLNEAKLVARATLTDSQIERSLQIEQRLAVLQVNSTILGHLPDLAADRKWLEDLKTWRAELCTRLMEFPRVVRDKDTQGRRTAIIYSLKVIDFGPATAAEAGLAIKFLPLGKMMRESGYEEIPPPKVLGPNAVASMPWLGTERETEKRIRAVEKRRDDAQRQIAAVLVAERRRLSGTADTDAAPVPVPEPVRKTRGDGSVYERHVSPDGTRVDVEIE